MKIPNPFDWFTSTLVTKLLSPYCKNLDSKSVSIGLWNGDITLRNIALKPFSFPAGEAYFDLETGVIDELKLKIPWKSIQKEPINLEIKGIKVFLSQGMSSQKTDEEKEKDAKQLKRESLKNFDKFLEGKIETGENDSGPAGFLTNLINKVGQNLRIKLSDIEVVYMFYISDTEIVKFGVKFECLELKPYPKDLFDNSESKDIHLRKCLDLMNLAIYFDIYDEFFLRKYLEDKNAVNVELTKIHHFILNNTSFQFDVEAKIGKETNIIANVSVTPLLLHLTQKQIRYLMKFGEQYGKMHSSRPKERPKKGTAHQWWKYIVHEIIERENIKNKVQRTSINTYIGENKYKDLYIKKCLNKKKLTAAEIKELNQFEEKLSLMTLLKLRTIALDEIKAASLKLRRGEIFEKKEVEDWFKKYTKDLTKASDMEMRIENKKKEEEKKTILHIVASLDAVHVVIRENDIIDSLKNLQDHVAYFKHMLSEQEDLRKKFIEQIKLNFVRGLNQTEITAMGELSTVSSKVQKKEELMLIANHKSETRLEDILEVIKTKSDVSEYSHKFLLSLSLEGILTDVTLEGPDMKVDASIKSILGRDLLGVNGEIRVFLNFSSQIKLYLASKTITIMNLRGVSTSAGNYSIIHFDTKVEIPRIDVFATKPFMERIMSLVDYITYEEGYHEKSSFDNEMNDLLFNSILRTKESINQQWNTFFVINNLNLFIPADYDKSGYMLAVHLVNLKVYKREFEELHENKKVIAVTNANAENEIFSQNFYPFIFTIQNLRAVIAKDYDWDLIENPFFFDLGFKEKAKFAYISTLFEILNIHISRERFLESFTLPDGSDVFPDEQKIHIKFPLTIIDLSIKNIYVLMNIVNIWSSDSASIKLANLKNSMKLQHKEAEKQETVEKNPTSSKAKPFPTRRVTDKAHFKPKLIDRSVKYNEQIISLLQKVVLNELIFECEGIVVNINTTLEQFFVPSDTVHHLNRIFSIGLHGITFSSTQKYFGSYMSVSLDQFMIEYYGKCSNYCIEDCATAIFDRLKAEEEESNKIVNEDVLKDQEHSYYKRKNKLAQEIKEKKKCSECHDPKSNHLLLNFVKKHSNMPDISVQIATINPEWERIVKQTFIQTEIKVDVADIVVTFDPIPMKSLNYIVQYGNKYSEMKFKAFKKFMREEYFWPEVKFNDYMEENESIKDVLKKEDRGIPLTEIQVNIPNISLVLLFRNNPVYFFALGSVFASVKSYIRHPEITVTVRTLDLHNISDIAGPHFHVLSTIDEESGNVLTIHMKNLDRYEAVVKNYSTWLGVKISGIKFVFLNRVLMELLEYVARASDAFTGGPSAPPTKTVIEESRSDLKLEVLLIGSVIEAPRNSLSRESLFFEFERLGFYSTGKWGDYPGKLIETGVFEFEYGEEDVRDDDWEDAISGALFDDSALEDNLFEGYEDKTSFKQFKKDEKEYPDDAFHLMIKEFRVKVREGGKGEENTFIKLARDSLSIDIMLSDKYFDRATTGQEDFPMRIKIHIPALMMFAYEPDFVLLFKLIFENLSESPQTVKSDQLRTPYWDKGVSLIVDLKLDQALIKIYTGDRYELLSKFAMQPNTEDMLSDFIHKNPNSLCMITLGTVAFDTCMRKNGAQSIHVNIKNIEMFDLRYKTKLAKEYRKIFASYMADLYRPEEDTTLADNAENFEPEEMSEYEINLDETMNQVIKEKEDVDVIHFGGRHLTKAEKKKAIPPKERQEEEKEFQVIKMVGFWTKVSYCFNRMKEKLTRCCKRKPKKQKNLKEVNPNLNKNTVETQVQPEELKELENQARVAAQNDVIPPVQQQVPPAQDANHYSIEFNPPRPEFEQAESFVSHDDKVLSNFLHDKVPEERKEELEANPKVFDIPRTKEDEVIEELHKEQLEEGNQPRRDSEGRKLEDVFPVAKLPFIIHHISEVRKPKIKTTTTEHIKADSDIFVNIEMNWDGDMNMNVIINNKSIVVVPDLLLAMVDFLQKPFIGTPNPPYMKLLMHNNLPPMRMKVTLNNFSAILLNDFTGSEEIDKELTVVESNNQIISARKDTFVLMLNLVLKQEVVGDSAYGPGRTKIDVELLLKRLFAIDSKDIFGDPNQKKKPKRDIGGPEDTTDVLSGFSLIETFRIIVKNKIELEYFTKQIPNPVKNDLEVELQNKVNLKNNFILSTEHLTLMQHVLQNLTVPSTATPPPQQKMDKAPMSQQPPPPTVVSNYRVKINKLSINLIKMVQGVELGRISFNKILLKMNASNDESKLRTIGNLDVQYFNRRKMSYEPLIEPWCFVIKYDTKGNDAICEIRNHDTQFDPRMEIYEKHLHKNALKINLSAAGLACILEISAVFKKRLREAEPYKIKNFTGFSLKLKSSNPSSSDIKEIIVENNKEVDISWKFFRQVRRRLKYQTGITGSQAFLDVSILKFERAEKGTEKELDILRTKEPETVAQKHVYKAIRQINCDIVGRKLYKIRSKEKGDALVQKMIDPRLGDRNAGNKNQKSATFLIASVHINPKYGSKDVILRSSVILRNKLDTNLYYKIVFINPVNRRPVIFEGEITKGGKYYLPIEAVEERAIIFLRKEGFNYPERGFPLAQVLDDRPRGEEYENFDEDIDSSDEYRDAIEIYERKLRKKTDYNMICYRGDDMFSFAITTIKKKVAAAFLARGSADEDFAYECYLNINPLISFTNAIVRPIRLSFFSEGVTRVLLFETDYIAPGKTQQFTMVNYREDLSVAVNVMNYSQSKAKKVYYNDRSDKYSVKLEPDPTKVKGKGLLYLWIETKVVSTSCRELVLYCPYFIVNEGRELLKYREAHLFSSELSEDIVTLRHDKMSERWGPSRNLPVEELESEELEEISRQDEIYNKIHMFSTSKKMNKVQIALRKTNTWSKKFSVNSADGIFSIVEKDVRRRRRDRNVIADKVSDALTSIAEIIQKKGARGEASQLRRKYEYSIRTEICGGVFNRSKILIITPRFAIKNETDQYFLLAQHDVELHPDNITHLRPQSWEYFHWADHRKPPHVIMSLSDSLSMKPFAWSGRFRIDEVDDFTLRLQKNRVSQGLVDEDYYYVKVIINVDRSTIYIRILAADVREPPYRIENMTTYEINFRQKPVLDENKKLLTDINFTRVGPGRRVPFTWGDMVGKKILEVEVEGVVREYRLDAIKDYEPIVIYQPPELMGGKRIVWNDIKKGFIYRKNQYDDDYREDYCVINVAKQKFKIYNPRLPNKKIVLPLRTAKIDEFKERTFTLTVEVRRKLQFHTFRAKSEQEALEWVQMIQKAALMNRPNMVHVKVEPVGPTRVIMFFVTRTQEEKEEAEQEEDILPQIEPPKARSLTFKVNITKMIEISLIDGYPRELLAITIQNLGLTYYQCEDDSMNPDNQIGQNAEFTWQRVNVSFTIDALVINNQSPDAQFPVILARTRKMPTDVPFIFIYFASKSPKKEDQISSDLLYINQFRFFIDTFEIRLDDIIIDSIFKMYQQLPFVESLEAKTKKEIYDYRGLSARLDDKIRKKIDESMRLYIKNLTLEPIELIFTFRATPGHKWRVVDLGAFADLGMMLASIDSAKIRLNYLQATHIFGSQDDVISRMTKHYTRQLMTQLYRILGSIDLLGNPVSLIENLGTGAVELFYNPFHVLFTGEAGEHGGFRGSLAHGFIAFGKGIVFGVGQAVMRIGGTIVRGMAMLTADAEYLRDRQRKKNRKIRSPREGFVYGTKQLCDGLMSGISGVLTKPCTESRDRGFGGCLRGTYSGFMGLLIKPIVGFCDFFAAMFHGIKNSTRYEENVMEIRSRPPRVFGENRLIINYDWSIAKGKAVIRRIKRSKAIEQEQILFYDEINIKVRTGLHPYQVILTDARFIYMRKDRTTRIFKIKLYKIKEVKYNAKNNILELDLVVPYKKKNYKLLFAYQSKERADQLLKEMAKVCQEKFQLDPFAGQVPPEEQDNVEVIKFTKSE